MARPRVFDAEFDCPHSTAYHLARGTPRRRLQAGPHDAEDWRCLAVFENHAHEKAKHSSLLAPREELGVGQPSKAAELRVGLDLKNPFRSSRRSEMAILLTRFSNTTC